MARRVSKGICAFCGQHIAKNAVSKHLIACEQRRVHLAQSPVGAGALRQTKLVELHVEAYGAPFYWLRIEIPADATLQQLDQFLRGIWLECCGHLSAFTIQGRRYSMNPYSSGKKSSTLIGNVFTPDVVAAYEYDFGSTTELVLKYAAERDADYREFKPQLLVQNEAPDIPCGVCGEPAEQICTMHLWEETGWLCGLHAQEHECDEDMFLPVVNSPRVGVCGYTGQEADTTW